MNQAGDEGRQGIVRDAQAGWNDVQVHDRFGDEQRGGCAIEAPGAREEVTGDAGEASAEDVVGREFLMLIGGGDERCAGGPERVEDDDQEEDAEEAAAWRDVA